MKSRRYGRSRAAALAILLAVAGAVAGCSATSIQRKVAKIGLQLVGDAIAEDEVDQESSQVLGRGADEVDRRYGPPRGVFADVASGREVRVYNVAGDRFGRKRWVIEMDGGRVDALSQAEEAAGFGTDKAKALALAELLRGKTPEEVRATRVMDKLMFDSAPRVLRRVPTGELVQVYDVTSFADIAESRFVVIGFDAARRCEAVRYVGAP